MLTFGEDRRRVELHKDKSGAVIHRASFGMSEPMPWRAEVDLIVCGNCFPPGDEEPAESAAIDAVIGEVQAKLVQANHAWAFEQIAAGATRLTEVELLAKAKGVFASTRLKELVKAGDFPAAVTASGRNVWIESEALEGIARVVARDTEAGAKKKAPMNRHERRKSAARR